MSGKEASSSAHLSPLNTSNKHLTGRNLFFPLALFSQVIPFILLPTNCLCLSPSRPVILHLYNTMHLTHFVTLPFPSHPLLSLPFPSITLGRASFLPTRKPPLLTVTHDEPLQSTAAYPRVASGLALSVHGVTARHDHQQKSGFLVARASSQ